MGHGLTGGGQGEAASSDSCMEMRSNCEWSVIPLLREPFPVLMGGAF